MTEEQLSDVWSQLINGEIDIFHSKASGTYHNPRPPYDRAACCRELSRHLLFQDRAHGRMTEEQLSDVWSQLINGEIDILVCTTIIETGVDVANVNTLIIENADRMEVI